jgi:CubicO group peptidase (beta-lactamase class C family)
VGEVVRRVTGQSLGDSFAAEVAGPLGADFRIGLSAEHDHRVALTIPPMACGGAVRGLRLLSQAVCDRAREKQFHGVDRILGISVRYGLGYGLFGSSYGWGGWGGSIVMIEPDTRSVVTYVTNQMRDPADDNRGLEAIMAAYDGLNAA